MDDKTLAAKIAAEYPHDFAAADALVTELTASAEQGRRLDRATREYREAVARTGGQAKALDARAATARDIGKFEAEKLFAVRRDGFESANAARAWNRVADLAADRGLGQSAEIAKRHAAVAGREACRALDAATRAERDPKVAFEAADIGVASIRNGRSAEANAAMARASGPASVSAIACARPKVP